MTLGNQTTFKPLSHGIETPPSLVPIRARTINLSGSQILILTSGSRLSGLKFVFFVRIRTKPFLLQCYCRGSCPNLANLVILKSGDIERVLKPELPNGPSLARAHVSIRRCPLKPLLLLYARLPSCIYIPQLYVGTPINSRFLLALHSCHLDPCHTSKWTTKFLEKSKKSTILFNSMTSVLK